MYLAQCLFIIFQNIISKMSLLIDNSYILKVSHYLLILDVTHSFNSPEKLNFLTYALFSYQLRIVMGARYVLLKEHFYLQEKYTVIDLELRNLSSIANTKSNVQTLITFGYKKSINS